MKSLLLVLVLLLSGLGFSIAQTIQPKIMVIPYTEEGEDLRSVLEEDEIKRVTVTKIKEAFDARGYTTIDFIAKMKAAKANNAFTSENQSDIRSQLIESSSADVYVQAEVISEKSESGNSVKVILTGFESSTGNSLANKIGESGKFYTDNYSKLASRAVESCIEDFLNVLQVKFTAIINNGKSVMVDISFDGASKYTMSSEIGSDGLPLSDQIEMWIEQNAFNNNYHIQGTSDLKMIFDDVRIPLKNPTTGSNYNPNKFALDLYKFFKTVGLQTRKEVKGSTIYMTIKSGTATIETPKAIVIQNSDVDINIPVTNVKDENAFALIIGNETYTREIAVPYAINDATTFSKYAKNVLGVPENQIHFVKDATFGQLLGEMDWITKIIKAYEGKAKVYFYYAGHGVPDEATKATYLLPVDGYSGNLRSSVKLADVYKGLSEYPSKSVNVFLDACFSGGSRTGMLTTGRGVKIKPKADAISGNMVVLSATSGDETAHPYTEKSHGLFTYYLLKKLQSSEGDINWQDLSSYVIENVNKKSVVKNKPQTPSVLVGTQIQATWKSLPVR
jgi:uncharacterized caspase-like protein